MKLLELFETEDTDQVYRLEAREAADKIQAWLSAHGQSAYKKFKKSANGISLPASSFDLPYTNLTIFLSKGEDSGSYGTFNADRDKKFIKIKIIRSATDFLNLDVRFKTIGRSIFIHEFIHYLDDTKTEFHKRATAKDLDLSTSSGWRAYINNPEEYNAFYQQATAKLEDRLDEFEAKLETGAYERLKDYLLKMTPQEFVEWFKSVDVKFFHVGANEFFDEKYARKLDKRLVRFFVDNIKPRLEQIEEAARIGTGVRKDEIPKKYKKYPLINRGTTSIILEVDANTVLMLTKDGIKKDWLVNELGIADMIDAYDSRHPKLGTMTVYVLKMPKLYPMSKENRQIARDLIKLLDKMNKRARVMGGQKDRFNYNTSFLKQNVINAFFEYFDEYEQTNEQEHILTQLIRFLSNYDVDQYEWDLRQGNFMQTRDGELVVLDPIVDKEILDVFRGQK